jgi:hypothetical protein
MLEEMRIQGLGVIDDAVLEPARYPTYPDNRIDGLGTASPSPLALASAP